MAINRPPVLVTGANGFIGSRIADDLLRHGFRVFGLVRPTSDLSFLKGVPLTLLHGRLDHDDLTDLPLPRGTAIVHAAALASDWGPLDLFLRTNVEGTLKVLRLALRLRSPRVVLLSSVAVMGFGHDGSDETAPWTPSDIPYTLSKREMERQALAFAETHRLDLVILRPGDVYGECDRTTTRKLFAALETGTMGFVSGGRALLAPLYVGNLCQAVRLALSRPKVSDHAFLITDGVRISWKDYITLICRTAGFPLPKLDIPYPVAITTATLLETVFKLLRSPQPPLLTRYRVLHAAQNLHFDISAARRLLGYRPDPDIADHIRRTVAWYRQDRNRRKRILVTGASGAWGWHLCRHLQGRHDVWATSRSGTVPHGIPHLRADLTDPREVERLLRNIRPDIIFHTAAVARPADCARNPAACRRTNVESLRPLVEQANLWKARLVLFSTDLVYPDSPAPHTETDPLGPVNLYERTKAEAERLVAAHAYDFVILRVAHTYGPGSPDHPSATDLLVHQLRQGHPLEFYDDQVRTPICVFDGVAACERLIPPPRLRTTFNLAGPETFSRYELSRRIAQGLGFDTSLLTPVHGRNPPRLVNRRTVLMDASRFNRTFRFRPAPLHHHLPRLRRHYAAPLKST